MPKQRRELIDTINQFYNQPVARVSFELVITVVVVMFFGLFAIRPTLLTMSDLIKEIDDKKTLNNQLGQKISALSTAQGEYLTIQPRLSLLDAAIPSRPQLISALKIVEKIASDRKIAIKSLSVVDFTTIQAADTAEATTTAPTASQVTRQNLNLGVTVSSDYLTIRQFIDDLQKSQRKITVTSVNFNSSDSSGGKTLEATLTLTMPYFGGQP